MILYTETATPLGRLLLVGDGAALTGVYYEQHAHFDGVGPEWRRDDDAAPFAAARAQLAAYFAKRRTTFDLPLAAEGTPFRRRVWRALAAVPFGETTTYARLARAAGSPAASRAVGASCGRNPLSIIVPCHRALASDGALTGYAGGLDRKRFLLALENEAITSRPPERLRRRC